MVTGWRGRKPPIATAKLTSLHHRLRLHKPELLKKSVPTEFEKHLFEQGNEVEQQARQLFPNGVLVAATDDEAVEETRRFMAAGTEAIFQATFLADGFYTKCDVLKVRGREKMRLPVQGGTLARALL